MADPGSRTSGPCVGAATTAERSGGQPKIQVRDLTVGYGRRVILRDVSFEVARGDVFVIMGGSGGGKSTLLRNMIGLDEPIRGDVQYDGVSFTKADADQRAEMLRRVGVLYQRGALWSSMTLVQNLELVLEEYTGLDRSERRDLASLKLALVGLAGFEDYLPNELSGGMQKRAGLARAIVLDPEVIFCDEPNAGLDPVTSRRMDELILELRDSLGATIVVVSHELASIFRIGDTAMFLDGESRTMIAIGSPRELYESCPDPRVQQFLNRGGSHRGRPPDRVDPTTGREA
jgi:phospholipid/cholesterol/gamma-HCH transport system ATP-binding protein